MIRVRLTVLDKDPHCTGDTTCLIRGHTVLPTGPATSEVELDRLVTVVPAGLLSIL